MKSLLRYVERSLPAGVPLEGGVIAATMVGTLQPARAIDSATEGKALCAATRKSLLDQYENR
ncbi:MAG: hypothetical protein ABI277_15600 [Burkholderiaceae bacterium]